MAKYRTRPVVIHAEQFLISEKLPRGVQALEGPPPLGIPCYVLVTHEGVQQIAAGDWVITELNGLRSVCKHEVFRDKYELVEEK